MDSNNLHIAYYLGGINLLIAGNNITSPLPIASDEQRKNEILIDCTLHSLNNLNKLCYIFLCLKEINMKKF